MTDIIFFLFLFPIVAPLYLGSLTPPSFTDLNSVKRSFDMSFSSPSTIFDYRVPEWARNRLLEVPKHGRLRLANLPTPLQKIDIFPQKNDEGNIFNRLRELNITLVVKRDDMTGGVELGGNKIRKLEFLLADAISKNCNEVVTIGGGQSNHCRATVG